MFQTRDQTKPMNQSLVLKGFEAPEENPPGPKKMKPACSAAPRASALAAFVGWSTHPGQHTIGTPSTKDLGFCKRGAGILLTVIYIHSQGVCITP